MYFLLLNFYYYILGLEIVAGRARQSLGVDESYSRVGATDRSRPSTAVIITVIGLFSSHIFF